jgi:hypothetical protein
MGKMVAITARKKSRKRQTKASELPKFTATALKVAFIASPLLLLSRFLSNRYSHFMWPIVGLTAARFFINHHSHFGFMTKNMAGGEITSNTALSGQGHNVVHAAGVLGLHAPIA